MKKHALHVPSPAMVIAMVALFVALGGTGYAATQLDRSPTASVAKKMKKPASDTTTDKKLFNSLIPGAHVAFAASAGSAATAGSAASAASAVHASSADSATNATNATNASNLGGLPASSYQKRTSQGNALAGARFKSDGTVVDYFNAYGGTPTVTHTSGTGVYDIKFPSAPFLDGNSVLLVTPDTPSANCTAVNADYANSGASTVIVVETKDCANTFADRGFHLVVFGDSTTS
jgi:hypothetical protein